MIEQNGTLPCGTKLKVEWGVSETAVRKRKTETIRVCVQRQIVDECFKLPDTQSSIHANDLATIFSVMKGMFMQM